MAADGHINIDTKIDGSGFQSGLKKLGGMASKTLSAMTKLIGGAATALGGAAVAGVKYNAQMEQYITSFGTMLGGAEKAQSLVSQLKKYAAETPFEFSDLAKGAQTLLSFGVASKDVMGTLKMLGDISQGNTEKFNSLALVFGQVSSAGKLSGQDLLQMINAGYNPLNNILPKVNANMSEWKQKALSAGMTEKAWNKIAADGKVTMSELRDIMSAGAISIDDVKEAFQDATSKGGLFYGSMEAQSKTFSGQLSTLKDNVMQFLGDLTNGLENSLKDTALPMVNGWMEQLQKAFSTGGVSGVASAFGNVLAQAVQQIAQSAPKVIGLATTLISSFVDGIDKNSMQISSAGSKLIVSFVQAIVDTLPKLIDTGTFLIDSILMGVAESFPKLATEIGQAIPEIVNDFVQMLPALVYVGMQFITYLLEGLADSMPDLIEGASNMVYRLVRVIIANAPQLAQAAVKLAAAFYTSLMQQNPPAGIALTLFGAFKGLSGTAKMFSGVADGIEKISKAGSLLDRIKSPIDMIMGSAGKMSGVFSTITSGLSTGFHLAGSALSSFFSVLAANPIILIIAAVAALVAGIVILWNTNEGFRNAVIGAWNAIASTAQNVFGAIAGFFTNTLPAAWNSVVSFFNEIPAWWIGLWTQVGQFFTNIWNSIIGFFTTTIPAWIASIGQWFQQLPYNLGFLLGQAVKAVMNFGVSVWNWITNTLPQIIQGIIQWFQQLPGRIWAFLVQIVTNIGTWGSNMWNYLSVQIPKIINGIGTWFSQLPGKIWTWLLNTIAKIGQWGSNMWNAATSAASRTISAVGNWFSQLPGRIWNFLTQVIKNIGSWGSSLWNTATSAVSNVVKGIIQWFQRLPGNMLNIGRNIITGIWNGITSGASWLWGKIKGFCNDFIQGFKDGLGIHSPSKLFADEVGKFVPPGISIGVDKAMPGTIASLRAQISEMMAQAREAIAAEQARVSASFGASVQYQVALAGGYATTDDGSVETPKFVVENHISMNDREFAVAAGPAIAKQLGFEG
jgi:phage-related protein